MYLRTRRAPLGMGSGRSGHSSNGGWFGVVAAADQSLATGGVSILGGLWSSIGV